MSTQENNYCNIAVYNNGLTGMWLTDHTASAGSWGPPPPAEIDPGQLGSFLLVVDPFGSGAAGTATYQFAYYIDGQRYIATVQFIFSNPNSGNNVVDWQWIDMPDPRYDGTITFFACGDYQVFQLNSVQADDGVNAVYMLVANS